MCLPIGKIPDQPRVDGPESQATDPGPGSRPLGVPEQPLDLGRAEVGIQFQAGFAADQPVGFVLSQRITNVGGAAVLPDDGVGDRLAGVAIPEQRSFSLVGDANRRDVTGRELGQAQCSFGGVQLGFPDRRGIMLDPARSGLNLRKLTLCDRHGSSEFVENNRPRTGRPLIQCKNM